MGIDFAGLIDSYGYLAVLVGAFLEGETLLALAGLAAYRGYLDFYTVVAIALVAGFAGDQCFFFLGRYQGARMLARFPSLRERALRVDAMLARWHAPLIVAIRFMYGLRIAGPILLGMGRVSSTKFVVFNLIGAAIWAPLVAGIGYFFGSLIEVVLGDMQQLEIWLLAAVLAACVIAMLVRHLRSHRA
jgi:membrane protein DedA with SNARE-associated domain